MASVEKSGDGNQRNWRHAVSLQELEADSVKLVRVAGKQIAMFATESGVRACDNRCPHEGYPLSEGSLSSRCILTCNWHNWKFDLNSGDNLLGGDRLRTYPTEIRDGEVWVDITELPFEERYEGIIGSLRDAFDDYSYDRIAREIARLIKLGADPMDALRFSIEWSWNRMEFGWTHAFAGMADWLMLFHEHSGDDEVQLVCLVESATHASYDVLREPVYPFGDEVATFDEEIFVDAVEREDETTAVAALRGGIRDGLGFADFERALTRVALAHYNDFGHSLIYVTKARYLIEQLGPGMMEPLLLSLARSIIYARREDKIPEFRDYSTQLENWGKQSDGKPDAERWRGLGISRAMQAAVDCSQSPPEAIYQALLLANANNLLSFDIAQQDKVHVSVSGNVGWLDFTHGLTFSSAVREQCARFPELWAQGLLQMACFSGRNAAFTNKENDLEHWRPANLEQKLQALLGSVLDHGQGEHIVSVHLLKTLLAVRTEMEQLEQAEAELLLASVTRFFESPLKRRQPRRTAYQSLQFVSKE